MKNKRRSHPLATVLGILVILLVAAGVYVYSGLYDIGADSHHSRPVLMVLTTLRQRSIEAHSQHLVVPDLDDPSLILKGAGQYAAMCTGCHLAPGMKDSEIRPGLYPQPPELSQMHVDPKQAFWVIKHGIKMSAMPAWGGSHDDLTIWSMVAFLQKLPGMSVAQYRDIVARAPPDEDMGGDGATPARPAGAAGIGAAPASAGSILGPAAAPSAASSSASAKPGPADAHG